MRLGERVAVLLLAIVVTTGLVVAVSSTRSAPVDLARHVESRVTSLTGSGPFTDPIWLYLTADRDFRICPNGSGQIAEHVLPPGFPTPAEELQWLASGMEDPGGVNESFDAGELSYITATETRAGVSQVDPQLVSPGDGLTRLASLLGETVPTTEVSELALAKAIALAGTRVERSDGQVALAGVTGNGELEVALVFKASPARLLKESWQRQRSRPGLDLTPPFLVFEREILESETEDRACGAEPAK